MGVPDLFQIAGQFGPIGIMTAYLVWRDTRDDRMREADTVSREKLAASLTLLTAIIQGRGNV